MRLRLTFVLLMTSKTYHHLTREQRYQIQALRHDGKGPTAIAKILDVHKSTISRELKRNSTHSAHPPDKYKAANAQIFATRRAYKTYKLTQTNPDISRRITFLLKAGWSPQQIADTCSLRAIPMLSTEAIYLWIYDQKARHQTDYTPLLRRHHRKRRKRRLDKQPRTIINDKVSIHLRPEEVNSQERSGDMETDLVQCKSGYLLTITDRKTLFNLIAKLPNKEAATVAAALIIALTPYNGKIHTITSDNGTEFARHKEVAKALDLDWYFADPYSSQQRGCNENQNGLFRQYFTRKTDLSQCTNDYILKIQNKLNYRPRKKLNYQLPIKLFLHPSAVALAA